VQVDSKRYESLLADLQRLRGRLYLQDGAIEPRHLTGERHQLETDKGSWHILVLDEEDRVSGCMRCREYPNDSEFSQLGISNSALARCDQWGEKLQGAVEAELALSRRLERSYAEVGGWALLENMRGTIEALRLVLAAFALGEALGGFVVISTATRRHGSASMLKRIGGRPLEYQSSEVPSYLDPNYKCEMEVLRFYSWAPHPRFRGWMNEIKMQLQTAPVFASGAAYPGWIPGAPPQAKAASAGY
jgi:hypothetical protein